MLIETVDEMNELPAGSVILDRVGKALQTSTEYDWPYKRVQKFLDERGPFILIHPRRYSDEELGTVAAAIETRRQLSPRADSVTLARAALDALEGK